MYTKDIPQLGLIIHSKALCDSPFLLPDQVIHLTLPPDRTLLQF